MTQTGPLLPLAGKVVLVTGASRGIGRAIAQAAGSAGACVVVTARGRLDATLDDLTRRGIKCHGVLGDVAEPADAFRVVRETVDRFGRVDVLINNAATLVTGPLMDASYADFDRSMRVNVGGPLLTIQAAGRQMRAQGEGVIINIGSDLALRGRADYAIYCASKGALLQLTRAAAIELGEYGIRVVMLSPAVTNTEMASPALSDPAIRRDLLAKSTIGRINEPEDVATAAIFLASPAARTVTGCNWPIDGGVLAR
jgi:meso-butanediol dehydrogenase / (S,S)-butanediol dehydrogenase / diacetyl reductase